ncbi:hypothetical protein F7725_027379 [Dissostichus mawsoni]|uniref:Uncharacterized protein n=1 Tax=Dissostichus mawsoni TaxID=36200 RepID=A0A7J5XCZ9_DISMA|nr:hypothetical protein F7725_027379 [Dissostichus mawsoni]
MRAVTTPVAAPITKEPLKIPMKTPTDLKKAAASNIVYSKNFPLMFSRTVLTGPSFSEQLGGSCCASFSVVSSSIAPPSSAVTAPALRRIRAGVRVSKTRAAVRLCDRRGSMMLRLLLLLLLLLTAAMMMPCHCTVLAERKQIQGLLAAAGSAF